MKQITKRQIEEKIGRNVRKQIDPIIADRDAEQVVLLQSTASNRYKLIAVGKSFKIDSLAAVEEFAARGGWYIHGFLPAKSDTVAKPADGASRSPSPFSPKAKQEQTELLSYENTSLKKKLADSKKREAELVEALEKLREQASRDSEDVKFVFDEKSRLEQLKVNLKEQEQYLQFIEDEMLKKMDSYSVMLAELDQREDNLAARERKITSQAELRTA
jgi:hypothetical protein